MHSLSRQLSTLSAVLVVAALAGGCSPSVQQSPAGPSNPPAPSAPSASSNPPAQATSAGGPATTAPPTAVPGGSHGGRSPAGGSPAAAGGRPADWPPQVPVPRGAVTGFTGSAGRWSVALVSTGPADEVRRATVALYEAAGFTPVTDSVLNMGHLQITVVVENRDHSATETNMVVGVTTI